MTKNLLWLVALAAITLASPAGAAAQRVGPVEDEPTAAATSGGAAKAEKKTDAAKPAANDAPTKAGDDKAAAKSAAPAPADKPAPETGGRAGVIKDVGRALGAVLDKPASETEGKAGGNVGDAKPSSTPLSSRPPSPRPNDAKPSAAQPSAQPNGDAAHAARGEKAATRAPAQAAPARQTNLPAVGRPPVSAPPAPPKYEAPAPVKADTAAASNATAAAETAAPAPTSIYRLGAGDILDIRLTGSTSREPTLYTVLSNGSIDYPLAGDPVQVAGLTPEEIGSRLSAALRRRGIYDRAQFQISVREYVSHTALVSGLVDQPGQKVLRREAVPLYVVLAESFPRPEAGRVVIMSGATGQTRTLDLSDADALNEPVSNGDVINVQPRPREYFYIGGQVASGGQKDFNPGLTLTQAILASGGLTREAGAKVRVAVARQGADGRLVTAEYDLREIRAGRVPDPRVQPGDRIEVGRRR